MRGNRTSDIRSERANIRSGEAAREGCSEKGVNQTLAPGLLHGRCPISCTESRLTAWQNQFLSGTTR